MGYWRRGGRVLRAAVAGATLGAVVLGSAWAVVGRLEPDVPSVRAPETPAAEASGAGSATSHVPTLPRVTPPPGVRLPAGQFLAGAAKRSIAPDPSRWLPNIPEGTCGDDTATYLQAATRRRDGERECLATFDHRWATTVDPDGLFVRAAALSNGVDTVVFAALDAVGWFAAYPADVCGDCGADAIARAVAARTAATGLRQVSPERVVIVSSHSHAAPDTLSHTPTWYFHQVRDAIVDALVSAVGSMEPVVVETGAAPGKAYNVDRRIATRAVPDYEVGWVRAFRPGTGGRPDRTVVTLVNFSVHPTVRVANAELHGGFVGPLTRHVEQRVGGAALWFPGGLGDQTVDRGFGTEGLGRGLASTVVDDLGRGHRITDNSIDVERRTVDIPGENSFMVAGRAAGLFVRDLLPPYSAPGGPVVAGKAGIPRPSCQTVATLMVRSSVTGIRIGRRGAPERGDPGDSVTIVTAPGEIFSSISLVTKDVLSKTRNVLVLGMANDTVGYLIPYEQYDETAAHGAGFAHNATDLGNYEEALSLGRCAGDVVQNAMLEVGDALGVMGSGESR